MNSKSYITSLFAFAMAALLISPAAAQSIRCAQEHFISEFDLDEQPSSYQILANNTLAVLHLGASEIRFYDLGDDADLAFRSAYPLSNPSARTTLHANGNDLYVTVPQTGEPASPYDLIVLNVKNPDQPVPHTVLTVLQSFDFAEFIDDTAYFMNNAGYGAGNSIYHAYDISDPGNLSLLHRINMGIPVDNEQGMQISNGLMHLSTSNRLMTFSVDGLGHLQWLHTFNFGGDRVRAMEARDQHVFLYHAGNSPQPSFEIYDFSVPTSPIQEFQRDVATTRGIRLDGQYAYLVGNDITAWNAPDPAAAYETAAFTDYAVITDLFAHEDRLYVIHNGSISVYDGEIRDAGRPQEVRTPTSGEPSDMVIRGHLAYIADGSGGTAIYDVTDPLSPVFINSVSSSPSPSSTTRIDATANRLFAVNGPSIEIYTLDDPSSPALQATIDGFQIIKDIAVEENTLVVMAYDPSTFGDRMVLYDITDPSMPVAASTTAGFVTAGWVEIFGGMIFAYDSSIPFNAEYTGLTAFDISDTANPVLADKLVTAQLGRAAYQDGYLYVCSDDGVAVESNLVLVFDVADPYNTAPVAEIRTGVRPLEIAAEGDMLVVESNGLFLYDISDPLEPRRMGTAPNLGDFPASVRPRPSIVGDSIIATQPGIGLISYDAGSCSACAADINFDGALNFYDVSAFLAAYTESEPIADFNNDSVINFFDVSGFIASYNAGCP